MKFAPRFAFSFSLIWWLAGSCGIAKEPALDSAESLDASEYQVELKRQANRLFASSTTDGPAKQLLIPRVFASLRSTRLVDDEAVELVVTPEPNHWVIVRKDGNAIDGWVSLEFDSKPKLEPETRPIRAAGDGTFTLPANQAKVSGEKLRFEPQPHKNTVGYWTHEEDTATWTIRVERPGSWNVGILQGCGQDEGGSVAELRVVKGDNVMGRLEFKVLETGHFQNFVWRDLGTIQLERRGIHQIVLQPKHIHNVALMDVRMVHLSPRPTE